MSRFGRSGPGSAGTLALIGALLVALAVLAVVQYRWIAQLGEAEKARRLTGLGEAAQEFCDDLDRELDRALAFCGPPPPSVDPVAEIAARLARWRESAPFPGLVSAVFVAREEAEGRLSLARLDEATGEARECEWPAPLEPLRRQLPYDTGPPLRPDLAALVVPLAERSPGGPPPGPGAPSRAPAYAVVQLDLDWIVGTFLPQRSRARFGGADSLSWHVAVLGAGPARRVLYAAGPDSPAEDPSAGDLVKQLFLQRSFPETRGPRAAGRAPRRAGPAPRPADGMPRPLRPEEGGAWQLVVRHPSGSLDALVASFRARNLAVSFGVLLLLGAAALLVLASGRRAARLARQQMEFVAAVTHELRTPLTAIRSAGQNLAAGIVGEPERVRRYGALIEKEGRRLSEMVSRVLAFARIESGQQAYRKSRVKVADLVDATLAGYQLVLEEKGIQVERHVDEGLPSVEADAGAVELALRNLLDNAMKYGADGKWVALRASASPDGREVLLTVSDRGRGIVKGDLSRIFEPFYRAEEATAGGVQGSGLGLAVVQHVARGHGGRVTVKSARGRGSDFTLHLKAAPGNPSEGGAS